MATVLHIISDFAMWCLESTLPLLDGVDQVLEDFPPILIISETCLVLFLLYRLHQWVWDSDLSLFQRGKRRFFKMLRSAPIIGSKIQEELKSTKSDIARSAFKLPQGLGYQTELPETGIDQQELLENVKKNYIEIEKIDWKHGKVSGTVYTGQHQEIMGKVFEMFAGSNLLQPGVFPGARKMEAEIVAMCCNLFKGGPNACGTTTSGGTESILLACLAYREYATARGIKKPEILIPECGHAAFEKAAHIFKMRLVQAPLDKKTHKADVKAMERLINKNTCMMVVSAACFPHGIIDPVTEVAKLGLQYGIPVHIDMCMGGFLYPFLRLAGYDLPPADLSVHGITSISADLHKYGLTPKGSSVVLYSDTKYREGQFFVSTDWLGGVYASPTLAGSRSGAIVATAWASLMLNGLEGYVNHAKRIMETRIFLEKEIRDIPGLDVLGEPELNQFTITSSKFDIYRLAKALTDRGYNLYVVQRPAGLCVVVTDLLQAAAAKELVQDVRQCTADIMKNPTAKADGMAAVYGMAASLPDRSLVAEFICGYLDAFYSTTPLQE